MNKFYTQTGDDGYTGLIGKKRVPKYHRRIEAVGSLDEANSALGFARSVSLSPQSSTILLAVQRDIYLIMAEVAATPDNASHFREINKDHVKWLEEQTDEISRQVSIPKDFIIPGDCMAGASFDIARTIIRRAERNIAYLTHKKMLENQELLRYLNRLSSLCYILELLEIQTSGSASPTLAKDSSKNQNKNERVEN